MFGTSEPKPYPLSDELRSWADAVRKGTDAGRIHADVSGLPAPRSRLHAPEAMLQADHKLLAAFNDAGWPAERQPFSFDNAMGYADYGHFGPVRYARLDGANIVAARAGVAAPQEAIAVLGHHDTVRDSPGADDNTASAAALLELARTLGPWQFRRTVVLAVTDMEELGFFGARALLKGLAGLYRTIAAINFETMGYTDSAPGSQALPPGLGLLYGGQVRRVREGGYRGDFTAVIYNGGARPLASMMRSALVHLAGPHAALLLRDPNDLPVIGKLLNRTVPAVRNFSRSDHVPFWEARVPAIMLTDTANFRYRHYHQLTDTPDKVDYERVGDIVAATATVLALTAGLVRTQGTDKQSA